jgi:hypothetical protein
MEISDYRINASSTAIVLKQGNGNSVSIDNVGIIARNFSLLLETMKSSDGNNLPDLFHVYTCSFCFGVCFVSKSFSGQSFLLH